MCVYSIGLSSQKSDNRNFCVYVASEMKEALIHSLVVVNGITEANGV